MEHRTDNRVAHISELVLSDASLSDAPASVRDTYKTFWDANGLTSAERETQEREITLTATLLADFCDEYISPHVYTAAMLCPIIEAIPSPDTHVRAMEALRVYTNGTDESARDKWYTIGLAADRPVIGQFWRDSVTERYNDNPDMQNLLQTEKLAFVSPEQWKNHSLSIDPKQINALVSSVNLESLLIKATELLAQLDPKTATNDSQTLNRAHQAEALFAPLCEIIGFDALAMALYSHVHVLRAMFTGDLAPLQQAQEIIDERGDKEQVDNDVQKLFDVVFGDNIHEQVIKHGANHGIMMGEGFCTRDCLRVNWRLKSVGSLTKKLDARAPEKLPLDIIGATVTTQDVSQIASRLNRILERASTDERITLTPTSERTAAIHVKGTSDYIETIREGLGFESIEAMREVVDVVEVDAKAHRVCKVTLIFVQPDRPDLRAEIQITTQSDRTANRIGQAAHTLYKIIKQTGKEIDRDKYAQDLAYIHKRKEHLSADRSHLTGASLKRTNALYTTLTTAVRTAPPAA